MLSLQRRAYATLALIALAGLGGTALASGRGEEPRERHEYRPVAGQRTVRRPTEARQIHGAHPSAAQAVHATAQRAASYTHEHPPLNDHRQMVARSIEERRAADGELAHAPYLAGSGRVSEISGGLAGGQLRVVRYGNTLSGTVERTIRPGLTSRTFVAGGHVLYTHVYQQHVWHQYGRAFAFETFVPAMRYPAVYYSWALAAWPRPLPYSWGWQMQPWYPVYGAQFTPYPVYTSPDLWMTDYILAQSMQTAYQAQTVPAPGPLPQGALAPPASDSNVASPAAPAIDAAPPAQPSAASPPPPSAAPATAPSGDYSPAPAATPPTITPQVKAQLNEQIKVQLREQQAAAATPVSLTTQSSPPALRPNHVFFEVVQSLEVPSGTANRYCSLSPNDYIKRTGGMSDEDWMIPVVVELSGPSDCPQGLRTRIGLNDLNAMENEQEARVMEAMQAASKSMGPNGPPSGPGSVPTLIADGSAAPDPRALDALRQAR